MERFTETLILGSRWLLAPLYLVLCFILILFGIKAIQEVFHLAVGVLTQSDADLLLGTLTIIDLVLVANLLVMVALSSYETFVSRFDKVGDMEKPAWLGKLDPGTVKLKLAASIVAISSIHLLKVFMQTKELDSEKILVLLAVHLGFVVSALMMAWVDRIAFSAKKSAPK